MTPRFGSPSILHFNFNLEPARFCKHECQQTAFIRAQTCGTLGAQCISNPREGRRPLL
jgi:hypothetical protein